MAAVDMRMVIFVLVLVLVLGLAVIVEVVWDSEVGAWVAVGLVLLFIVVRVLGLVPWLPDWWPYDDSGDD